jgi:hypothetical protein
VADFEQCGYHQGELRCLRPTGHQERHRFAPTKALQDQMGAIVLNTDEDLGAVPEQPVRPITHALSRVDDNLLIAWDVCGTCGLHITICQCSAPSPPSWVSKFLAKNQPGTTVTELLERQGARIADSIDQGERELRGLATTILRHGEHTEADHTEEEVGDEEG